MFPARIDLVEVRFKAQTRRATMLTAELVRAQFPGSWSSRLIQSRTDDSFILYLHVVAPKEENTTLNGGG